MISETDNASEDMMHNVWLMNMMYYCYIKNA